MIGQYQNAHGAVDGFLRVAYTLREGLFLIDQSGRELRGVDFSADMELKCRTPSFKNVSISAPAVVDDADSGDSGFAEMRPEQQRLRVRIADAADAAVAVHVN
jgi:hypothetical protein